MKMNRKQLSVGLLFLIGLSFLLYPTISNQWNQFRENQLIATYSNNVEHITNEEIQRQREAAAAYNNSLIGSSVPDAFSVREDINDPEYNALLNVNNDLMMAYLEIPKINVEVPIFHYTTEKVLEKGAGHLFGSSLPTGEKNTHAVISAHCGLPSAKFFTDLDEMEIGDKFYVDVLDERHEYQVDKIKTVLPTETTDLAIEKGKSHVTLLTCTPYGVNTHRLLVRGYRTDFTEDHVKTDSHEVRNRFNLQITLLIIGLIAFLLIFLDIRKRGNNEETTHKKTS